MTSAATIDALGNKQSMAVQELVRPDHAPIPAAQTLLNLGCGRKYRDGAVNLDIPSSDVRADVWHDLNLRPWPFEENTFTEVVANDVIEHLRDIIPSMEEIHRICRPGAVVRMTLPQGRRVSRVELLRAGTNLRFSGGTGAIEFTIPKVVDYEVAALYSA